MVTGGVVSSIGKGITAASIGRILRSYGVDVTAIKIDPYLNWDSGTLNPYQHGEVFVTDDGMETDLDLGHYERFLDVELSGESNITTGKVYSAVINKERKGDFLGACVQIIPHITDEIKSMIREIANKTQAEVVLVEVGGTVGDIESQPFLEALRQLRNEEGHDNVMFVHVTYVPYLKAAGEFKTKPTQHSTKELRSTGLNPDVIVCRSELPIDSHIKDKIAHFCELPPPSKRVSTSFMIMMASLMELKASIINLFKPQVRPLITRLVVHLLSTPMRLNSDYIKKELGFRPKIDFKKGVEGVKDYIVQCGFAGPDSK